MSNYLGSQRVALMQPRLPYEYQEVEYIESTGTQYIDTGYLQKNKVTVDCKFYNSRPTKNYLYGSTQSSGAMMYNGLYYNDLLEYNWKEVYYTASDYVIMTQRIVGDNTVVVINDQSFTLKTGTAAIESTIYIFACNGGTRLYYTPLRCYYFKIYDNNVLVRDFIPCYRKSDGEIGLFDLVEMKFYENKGSGDFVKGENNTQIRLFEKIMDTEFAEPDKPDTLLPIEYQQVEYVESDAHQVIDTQVIAKSGVSIEARVMWREISPDSALLGARHNGNRIYLLYQYPLGKWNIGYGNNYQAGSIEQDVIYDIEVTLRNGTQKFVVNGETQWTNTIAQDYDLGINLYLFNYNESGFLASYYSKARVYSLKMYINDVLVRDFIPCYRKSDGEVGLFDLVTQVFYKNLGSGALLKGGDVN